jgi:hypothetical protein
MSPLRQFKLRTPVLGFVMAISVTMAYADDAKSTTRLSAEQSKQVARLFCQKIGVPVSGNLMAESVTEPKPYWAQDYWRGLWQVQFTNPKPDQAYIIGIDDVSGEVIHYERVPSEHRSQEITGKIIKEVTKEDAFRRASSFMQAAGGLDELGMPEVGSTDIGSSPVWAVVLKRVFKGIRYSESMGMQHASVIVNAQDGSVSWLSKSFTTPPPTVMAVQVSPDEAFDTAQKIKNTNDIKTDGRTSITLIVVQPNTLWQKDGSEDKTLPETRLVWQCWNRRAGRRAWFGIWVDAITGEVRGGYQAALPTYPNSKGVNTAEESDDAPWLQT